MAAAPMRAARLGPRRLSILGLRPATAPRGAKGSRGPARRFRAACSLHTHDAAVQPPRAPPRGAHTRRARMEPLCHPPCRVPLCHGASLSSSMPRASLSWSLSVIPCGLDGRGTSITQEIRCNSGGGGCTLQEQIPWLPAPRHATPGHATPGGPCPCGRGGGGAW
jgi:hypothetical protein